jgi:hypothetical protein
MERRGNELLESEHPLLGKKSGYPIRIESGAISPIRSPRIDARKESN